MAAVDFCRVVCDGAQTVADCRRAGDQAPAIAPVLGQPLPFRRTASRGRSAEHLPTLHARRRGRGGSAGHWCPCAPRSALSVGPAAAFSPWTPVWMGCRGTSGGHQQPEQCCLLWAAAAIGVLLGVGFYAAVMWMPLLCMLSMSVLQRLELRLPGRRTLLGVGRFCDGGSPNFETPAQTAVDRGDCVLHDSLRITYADSQAVWRFCVVAPDRARATSPAALAQELDTHRRRGWLQARALSHDLHPSPCRPGTRHLGARRRSFQRSLSTRRFESSWAHTPRHHRRVAVRGRFLECLIHVPDRGLSRCRSTILRRFSAKSAASRHITAPCRLWAFGVAFGPSKTETYAAA